MCEERLMMLRGITTIYNEVELPASRKQSLCYEKGCAYSQVRMNEMIDD